MVAKRLAKVFWEGDGVGLYFCGKTDLQTPYNDKQMQKTGSKFSNLKESYSKFKFHRKMAKIKVTPQFWSFLNRFFHYILANVD